MTAFARLCAAAIVALAAQAHAQNHEVVIAPIGVGPFAVACSNVAQDEAAIAQSGAQPSEFWEGSGGRYVSQILAAPATAVRFDALVPDIRSIYPQHAGDAVEHVAIVCHPTASTNADADYVLPGSGDIVPRMQPGGAAPRTIESAEYLAAFGIFLSPPPPPVPARLPLVVFSHGLGGSPLGPGYLEAMTDLASHGFMVGAVFHADARFSRIRIEDLGDFAYLLTDFDKFVEMELMRPVSLKAMVDTLLAHPGYGPAIDPDRIGGFGASMGGQAMANLLGARLTASLGLACRETVRDPRIKAAVGLVPYAGQTFLPAFCDDQDGAADVTRPYLALAGTADTTAPIKMVEQAVNRFAGSRYLVALTDVKHEYVPEHRGDVMTWTVNFLRAYLGVAEDPGAMSRLIRLKGVQGGPADALRVDVHVPGEAGPGETLVLEFYNEQLDHYFLSGGRDEIAFILAGGAPGWNLTGHAFKAYPQLPADAFTAVSPVCRFYGRPAGGPNSHFYTASQAECDYVKEVGGWFLEGIGFYILPSTRDGQCPEGYLKVLRAYNQGFPLKDANHRYTTSDSLAREMQRLGWALEGAVMCSRP